MSGIVLHHVHPLVWAHERGDCHDSRECPRCADDRAVFARHLFGLAQ